MGKNGGEGLGGNGHSSSVEASGASIEASGKGESGHALGGRETGGSGTRGESGGSVARGEISSGSTSENRENPSNKEWNSSKELNSSKEWNSTNEGTGIHQPVNQILATHLPENNPQREIEDYHSQSIDQILQENGQFISEADRERISNGATTINAIDHNPALGRTGCYTTLNGKSNIEISAISKEQMERTVKHETNHFASKNREIIVPDPERNGYVVHQTVGLRQSSWFHSVRTGDNSEFTSKGRGLNEGLTTMLTNEQLSHIDPEKGKAAEREGVYSHATELSIQLERLVGKDAVSELQSIIRTRFLMVS